MSYNASLICCPVATTTRT